MKSNYLIRSVQNSPLGEQAVEIVYLQVHGVPVDKLGGRKVYEEVIGQFSNKQSAVDWLRRHLLGLSY